MEIISKVCKKPFLKAGSKIGIDDVCINGMIISCLNCIVMFDMVKDMKGEKSKIAAFAFNSGSAYLVSYLVTILLFSGTWSAPALVAKLIISFGSVPLAFWFWKMMKDRINLGGVPDDAEGDGSEIGEKSETSVVSG